MDRQNNQAELDALFGRVTLEINSRMEDYEARAIAERSRFQLYYDTRKRELAAGKASSLLDGWQDREWWQDSTG